MDSHDRISIYTLAGTPLFFNHFDGPYAPTMKLLHKCKHNLLRKLCDDPAGVTCFMTKQLLTSQTRPCSRMSR